MKRITHASIRETISTDIAPKGTVWVGQIGSDFSNDQTNVHRTATAAAHEIADIYNADERNEGLEVRVVRVYQDTGDYCGQIIIREGRSW